jgi:glutathione S-transferase
MSLKLYFHPLASFCWKVLIALYENDTPFEPHVVDLGNKTSSEEFKKIWPIGKFPVLRDDTRGVTVPESSIIIEYLSQHYPGGSELLPTNPELALQTRQHDRFYDLYVHELMQKIVGDRLRPPGKGDEHGVVHAKELLETTYGMIDKEMETKTWVVGDGFTMADCAAAPALFYANKVLPFGERYRNVSRYLDRLLARPSIARTVTEAQPYFALFPQ